MLLKCEIYVCVSGHDHDKEHCKAILKSYLPAIIFANNKFTITMSNLGIKLSIFTVYFNVIAD